MADITDDKVLRGGRELWFTAALGDSKTAEELLEKYGDSLDVNFHSPDSSKYLSWTTPLHIAAHNGHLNMVRYLIESCGANVDAQSESGFTALHFAIVKGHIKCVKILLELGADRTIEDKNGWSPLDLAREWKREEIVALFGDKN